jgi:hypothetical protein
MKEKRGVKAGIYRGAFKRNFDIPEELKKPNMGKERLVYYINAKNYINKLIKLREEYNLKYTDDFLNSLTLEQIKIYSGLFSSICKNKNINVINQNELLINLGRFI